MLVVVASRNPVKINATREAFEAQFPGQPIEIQSADVDSGAGDQPDSDSATRIGARNRAIRASEGLRDADYWVGLEGGVEVVDDQLMAFAWMAIKGRVGEISEARRAQTIGSKA